MKTITLFFLYTFFCIFSVFSLHSMELLLQREELLLRIEKEKEKKFWVEKRFWIPLTLGAGCISPYLLPMPKIITTVIQQKAVRVASFVTAAVCVTLGVARGFRTVYYNSKLYMLENKIDQEITYSDTDLNVLHDQLKSLKKELMTQLHTSETEKRIILVQNALHHFKEKEIINERIAYPLYSYTDTI